MSIKAKRLGIRFDPPALLLEYESGKLRRRVMPIRNLTKTSTAAKIVSDLTQRHDKFLNPKVVSSKQLTKLIQKIIDKQSPTSSTTKPTTSAPSTTNKQPASDVDLNKIPFEEYDKIKKNMDQDFEKSRVKPGETGFIYDKRAKFVPKGNSDWDEDADDDDFNEDDLDDLIF